jgi:hypothetical protein
MAKKIYQQNENICNVHLGGDLYFNQKVIYTK